MKIPQIILQKVVRTSLRGTNLHAYFPKNNKGCLFPSAPCPVEQREVEREFGEESTRSLQSAGPGDIRPQTFQLGTELASQQRLILDDENLRPASAGLDRSDGRNSRRARNRRRHSCG